MAHWTRVITENDAPEWTSVLHPDGSLSEIKISASKDAIHIHVDKSSWSRVIVTGHESSC